MILFGTKNQLILPEKIEKKEETSPNIIAYPDEINKEKTDKGFLFQGSSGRILANVILYSIILLGKKMKKMAQKTVQVVSWKSKDLSYTLKNLDLWQYIPAKVFALAVSAGIVTIFMIDTGMLSSVVYGSSEKLEVYSAVSEGLESDVVVKKIGKLDDYQLVAVASKQCESDYSKSQNSQMCGADVKNKILEAEERRIEQERMAAARAAAARAASLKAASVKVSCAEKNDGHPGKSKTKGKHMDEDCCPDPDEWPKPGCIYSASGRALMLSGPSKKK